MAIRQMAKEAPPPINDDDGDEELLPFNLAVDLIERELNIALNDCQALRKLNRATKVKARNQCLLLLAAIRNARYYTKELDRSLASDTN